MSTCFEANYGTNYVDNLKIMPICILLWLHYVHVTPKIPARAWSVRSGSGVAAKERS